MACNPAMRIGISDCRGAMNRAVVIDERAGIRADWYRHGKHLAARSDGETLDREVGGRFEPLPGLDDVTERPARHILAFDATVGSDAKEPRAAATVEEGAKGLPGLFQLAGGAFLNSSARPSPSVTMADRRSTSVDVAVFADDLSLFLLATAMAFGA